MNPEEPQDTFTSVTETSFPEGPSVTVFTAQEIFALPQYLWLIQLLFVLLAAAFALAIFKRERNWAAALMGLACCCLAFYGVPFALPLLFPSSEFAMRVARSLTYPTLYAQFLGSVLMAGSLFLRWRGNR